MYPALSNLSIHHHHQEQLLDEAEKARLARTLKNSANQREEGPSLMGRRVSGLWVQIRQVAFGH